ncbi:NAD(P)/FAD-dependent oxidoreductase [Mucilaginibacter arboris]|uniref:NAD(P)-binding protein n=1 Tax=Mucilaginibacter arboris TaxID=2682090 RepID=A0A7K1SZV4_9SPHI|nr:NAD(P)/FAD-dependent oxidoreductase [Mucilaginibacter arboris]MVN22833.1 NAD(P)-binding protein [Mucilaginibacter arboris]
MKVIVIGGGLAGLFNAILLNRAGYEVTLIERKTYPFHRVCGEYISNEVVPFLQQLGIHPEQLGAAKISELELTGISGKKFSRKLGLGGFGISRYAFDDFLYRKAKAAGVEFMLNTKVDDVQFINEGFEVHLSSGEVLKSPLVIGSFGKRSNLDQKLKRSFFYQRSPFFAVKYHIKADFPNNLIQLNNFKGGYCGVTAVEDNKFCLCYLAHQKQLKQWGNITAFEEQVVRKNPALNQLFQNSDFLWNKPKVINEISFEKKSLVKQHILMSGDTAGMIVPLCGNGMSMAIHSAKILTENIRQFYRKNDLNQQGRQKLEQSYIKQWDTIFATRLWTGRQLQPLFRHTYLTETALSLLDRFPVIADKLIEKTHGQPFI